MSRPREDILSRINKKLARVYNHVFKDYCYIWTGYTNKSGYGKVNHNLGDPSLSTLAHRLVYQLLVKKDLGKLEVDHICKNRSCCNPSHLRAVTKQENLNNREFSRGETYGQFQYSI